MYDTAKEYADLIKAEEYEYAAEPEDLEERRAMLRKHYGEQLKVTRYDLDADFTPTRTRYQHILDGLKIHFCATLPEDMQAVFAERFYYTTVDNRRMYARIRRSPDQRFYALFISSSLITILHKLGKLSLAIHFPEMVLDCSRNPGQQVRREQLIKMYVETYAHFRETKLPLGPQIILDKQLDYPHFLTLTIQEKLLAYHEIAHFLNGDLETDADEVQNLSADYPNINYQREHYADLVGFGLLLREEKIFDKVTEQDRIRMLFALINLFGIQYDLQGPETSDYPHPYNRLLCIIECYYSKDTAEIVAQAIENDQVHLLRFDVPPKLESREEKFEAYIEQQLRIKLT